MTCVGIKGNLFPSFKQKKKEGTLCAKKIFLWK